MGEGGPGGPGGVREVRAGCSKRSAKTGVHITASVPHGTFLFQEKSPPKSFFKPPVLRSCEFFLSERKRRGLRVLGGFLAKPLRVGVGKRFLFKMGGGGCGFIISLFIWVSMEERVRCLHGGDFGGGGGETNPA